MRLAESLSMFAPPNTQKKSAKYFFREWRKFRKLTQEQLAEMVEMSPSSISQIEKKKQGFTDASLEALAKALECHPGELLMIDPANEDDPLRVWRQIPQEDRQQVLKIMKTYVREGDTPT